MKIKIYFLIVALLAAGGLWYALHKSRVATPQQQALPTNAATVTATPTQKSIDNSTAQPDTNSDSGYTSAVAEIAGRYNQGLISKDQAMLETIKAENLKSQDFYGKAVDQDGEPIANATVNAELLLSDGTYGGFTSKKYSVATDGDGLFEFTGLQGAGFNILISKAGYKMGDRGEGYKGAVGGKSSPANRVILTMWKIRGAEPLTRSGIDAKIPHDGTPITFDTTTGKESADGSLRVALLRSPLEVNRGRDKFNWTIKIEILQGGLIEESDPYPYWAPDTGYQSTFEFNVTSNDVPWHPNLDRNFYIKSAQGQYGLMKLHVNSSVTPARLDAGFTVNPSGSRNLEPDFSK